MNAPRAVDPGPIEAAAVRLAAAQQSRIPCAPVRNLIGPADIEAAYRVQTHNVDKGLARGRRLSGRKIGLTSPAVQQQLGVDQPDFGVLFGDMHWPHDIDVDTARLLQPRIEAEVAFTLSRDIVEPVTEVTVADYAEHAAAALEIVDSRIAGWDITLGDTIADNASCGLYVLGDVQPRQSLPDLTTITMTMTENGTLASRGVGQTAGQPLARPGVAGEHQQIPRIAASRQRGRALRRLGPMVAVKPGATYAATITGVGTAWF